jgi:hypothetical protein
VRDFDTLGSKLGPKLARLISQTIIATKRGMLPTEHNLRVLATQTVIDNAGREVAEHYRPLIRKILDADTGSLNPDMRMFLEDAISGEHQLKAIGGLLMGPAAGTIGTFISNELAPILYAAIRTEPWLHIDVQSAANGVAQRVLTDADGADKASSQGINNGQFESLVEMARSYPSMADGLDMLRRGDINAAAFNLILERNAVPGLFFGPWQEQKNTVLPADLAALAVLRGVVSNAEGQAIAARSGVTAADFQIMIADTGEPPGLQELLEAFRRKFISEPVLEKGIRESRVRDEWIPVIKDLRYSPISVADAVNAVVQNYLSPAEAGNIAEQNGLTPGGVDTLILTAGEPLSRTESEQLYNRGLMSKDEVIQALRESRLKNKYNNLAFELHTRLIEPRMLGSAVQYGVISHADAVKRALQWGYSQEDAAILVGEGSARKLQTYRNRVVSSAEGLFEQNAISETQLKTIAESMGFDVAEADFVVASADYRRKEHAVTAVTSAIRSKYVGHHIAKGQASALLDSAGIPADKRDYLLGLWDIERAANVTNLTEAQIVKAHKLKLLTAEEAAVRLANKGYSAPDAILLLEGA